MSPFYNMIHTDKEGNHTLIGQTDDPQAFMEDYSSKAKPAIPRDTWCVPDGRVVRAFVIKQNIFYKPLPIIQVDIDHLNSL